MNPCFLAYTATLAPWFWHIIQPPHLEVKIQEEEVVGIITQEEAPVAISQELFIVPELEIHELGDIKRNSAPSIDIIDAGCLEAL